MVVRNDGPDAAPGVVVTEDVDGPADVLSTQPSQGTCALGDPIRCDLGTIPAGGGQATVRVRVRPDARGVLSNQVTVTAAATDPSPIGELPALRTRVAEGRARLRLRKTATVRRARPGQVVGYRIALRSTGAATARVLRVCDRPPPGLTLISARGTRVRDGRACWSIPELAPGATRILRVNARVASLGGGLRNLARAQARNALALTAAAPLHVAPTRRGPCAAAARRAC